MAKATVEVPEELAEATRKVAKELEAAGQQVEGGPRPEPAFLPVTSGT